MTVHTGDITFIGNIDWSQTQGATFGVRSVSTELLALSGASATAAALIPAGALVLSVMARVTTDVTGATTLDIGDGTDVDAFGAAIALTAGTTTTRADWTISAVPIYPGGSDVVLTANGSNFTGGAVRIVCFYLLDTAPTA